MGIRFGIRNTGRIYKGIAKLIKLFKNILFFFLEFLGFKVAYETVVPEQPEFYKDIYDCPVDAYHKCMENQTLEYLVKKGEYLPKYDRELEIILRLINDQKIDEFGVSAEFELYYYKLREHNKLMIRLLEGDESARTKLDIIDRELKRLLKGKKEVDVRKSHARLARAIQVHYQGRSTHGMTVFEFYNDVADMMKEQDRMKLEAEKRKLKLKRRRG